jgi:hypothetical protein
MAQLVEWSKFAAENFSPAPSRRVGKRWVLSGEVPGRVIGGDVYVDVQAFQADAPGQPDRTDDKFGLM